MILFFWISRIVINDSSVTVLYQLTVDHVIVKAKLCHCCIFLESICMGQGAQLVEWKVNFFQHFWGFENSSWNLFQVIVLNQNVNLLFHVIHVLYVYVNVCKGLVTFNYSNLEISSLEPWQRVERICILVNIINMIVWQIKILKIQF